MIRPATPADVPEILTMIAELAAYEKEPDAAVATADQLRAALFGPAPAVFARIAAEVGADGTETVVGMAVYFRTFSTWTGTHGIWLEDLYVRPGVRGGGHGKQLLAAAFKRAVQFGYKRKRVGRENRLECLRHRGVDLHAGGQLKGHGCLLVF